MNSVRLLLGLGVLAVLWGCREEEITTYRVAKQEGPTPAADVPGAQSPADPHAGLDMSGTMMGGPAAPAGGARSATFQSPSHWESQALTAMREASFVVKGEGGVSADVSLIILAGTAGDLLGNVNRWLSQLGQSPISAERLREISQPLPTPLGEMVLVDLEGARDAVDAAKDGRILAAIVAREDGTWFFKMRGNAALVAAEKANFLEWVRSTRAVPAAPATPAHPPVAAAGDTVPPPGPGASTSSASSPAPVSWSVPAEWKALPASQMRYASFAAGGADGKTADISVVALPGDSGGDLANVNRWRQQVGLAPVGEAELKSQVVRFAESGAGMSVVDLAGADRRMVAGWTRSGGQTWFFKMTGAPAVVEGEKGRFLEFLRSVKLNDHVDQVR